MAEAAVVTIADGVTAWRTRRTLGADIKLIVADFFGVTPAGMVSPSRLRTFVYPRQIAMYLVRLYTAYSYPQIGAMFGGRDHTTVLYAYRKVCKQVAENAEFAELVQTLVNRISEQYGIAPGADTLKGMRVLRVSARAYVDTSLGVTN